jgi:hypothetical protein
MAIRNGQKKINPESDRVPSAGGPRQPGLSGRLQDVICELPKKKAYCGEAAR